MHIVDTFDFWQYVYYRRSPLEWPEVKCLVQGQGWWLIDHTLKGLKPTSICLTTLIFSPVGYITQYKVRKKHFSSRALFCFTFTLLYFFFVVVVYHIWLQQLLLITGLSCSEIHIYLHNFPFCFYLSKILMITMETCFCYKIKN